MMKTQYYLEIKDSDKICGGVYPLGEMTEKQALKECKKRIKDLWRSDKKNHNSISFNLCADDEALDLVYAIDLYGGEIKVYDWRTEEFIEDTWKEKYERRLKKLDESLDVLNEISDVLNESGHEKNDSDI